MKKLAIMAVAATIAVASVPAGADTLYANPLLLGATPSPGTASFSANSGGGAGSLVFDIDGFASLDGVNFYEDDFTLVFNGATILSLSYDLGGGGGNVIFPPNVYGATVTGGSFGFFNGGKLTVNIASLPLVAGSNLFTFNYDSPGAPNAGPQGLGDEGFGISNVRLLGPGAVAEPATWGMMILGFGVAGAAMRRRSTKIVYA